MNRRILTLLLIIFILTGLAFSAVPYLSSLKPVNLEKSKIKLRVDLRKMPENSVKELKWHDYKVFIVKYETTQNAFLIPFKNGAYLLPDAEQGWAKAVVPCKKIQADYTGFACIDAELPEVRGKSAQWNIKGKAIIKNDLNMPDMQQAPYKIFGSFLVVDKEYKQTTTPE